MGRATPGAATRYGFAIAVLIFLISASVGTATNSLQQTIYISLLLVVLTETVLRVKFRRPSPPEIFYRFHPFKAYEAIPNATLFSGAKANSVGFRGEEIEKEKPDGVFRIFLLGGSTTFDGGLQHHKRTEDFIKEELEILCPNQKIELMNCALPGYNSMQSLVLIASDLVDYSPDVIIFMHSVNDATMRLLNLERSDYSIPYQPYISPKKKFWESSVILSMLFAEFTNYNNRWFWVGPKILEKLVYSEKYYQAIRAKMPPEIAKKHLDEGDTYTFRRNMISIIGLGKVFGFDLLLCTAPINNHPDRIWEGWHTHWKLAILENNIETLAVANKYKVPCIDLAKEYNGKKGLFYDSIHMNGEGQKLKSKKIADAIAEILSEKS